MAKSLGFVLSAWTGGARWYQRHSIPMGPVEYACFTSPVHELSTGLKSPDACELTE